MANEEVLNKLEELRSLAKSQGVDLGDQINQMEQRVNVAVSQEPAAYPAWYNVQLSRRQDRPKPKDFVAALIDNFIEF